VHESHGFGDCQRVGGQELKCAFLPLLTEAMERAGLDPVEFFKKNVVKPGDPFCCEMAIGGLAGAVDYTKAMEKAPSPLGGKKNGRDGLSRQR